MGLAMTALVVLTGLHPFAQRLENTALDAFYRLRGPRPAPDDFLIIAIDEPSFQAVQLPWPWPRGLHAALVDRLTSAGAKLIVLDIVFAEPGPAEDDQRLAAALRESGNVVLAQAIDVVDDPVFFRTIRIDPIQGLRQSAKGMGLAVITPDPDGVVRRFSARYAGQWTLAGASILAIDPESALHIGNSRGLIAYMGPSRTMRTVSYAQVLDPDHPLPEAFLRGKYVFVGLSLAAQPGTLQPADAYATPYLSSTGGFMPGVEIHANIMHTILTDQAGRMFPFPAHASLTVLMLGLAALLIPRQRPMSGLLLTFGLTSGLLVASYFLFTRIQLWIEPMRIVAGIAGLFGLIVMHDLLSELRAKMRTRKALSRYLAPNVVEHLVRNPEKISLGGEEVQATVLMADLSGFTTLSENLRPADLIGLLGDFFTPATEIILQEGGTLDKYLGDAIMAFWGAPLHIQDHARRAASSALAICRVMEDLRGQKQAVGLPVFSGIKIGLHSGRVVVGNVGSTMRHDYTCLGDTVNLTSRLESLNKQYGTRILMSEVTMQSLGNKFLVRNMDTVRVMGRSKALTVYELLDDTHRNSYAWIALYDQARQAYQKGDFTEAASGFQKVLDVNPDDGPTRTLQSRCHAFMKSPPSEWDGIFTLDRK